MAWRNEQIRTPDWLRVEIGHDPREFTQRLDIGIKCNDGWAHIVSLDIDDASAYLRTGHFNRLKLYQQLHEFVTRKLAVETLEKT
jgi:hypothetical protein